MKYEIKTAKTGRKYLKITIEAYEAVLFPSKAEMVYLTSITGENAHGYFLDDETDN